MSTKRLYLRRLSILFLIASLFGGIVLNANPVNSKPADDLTQPAPPGETSSALPSGINDMLGRELLAKAAPDECYNGIGNDYPPGPPCEQGIPMVNQAYVWGLVKAGDDLWFGTAPNVHCLVFSGYLGVTQPHEAASWVCEFGESQYSPPMPGI